MMIKTQSSTKSIANGKKARKQKVVQKISRKGEKRQRKEETAQRNVETIKQQNQAVTMAIMCNQAVKIK